jgi:hypothetical protein
LADSRAEPAACRLAGRLQAVSADIEKPAVEKTAQPTVLQTTKGKIGAPVWAVAIDESQFATLILEKDHVLPKDSDGFYSPGPAEFLG